MINQFDPFALESIEVGTTHDGNSPFVPTPIESPGSHIPANELEPGVVYLVEGVATDELACVSITEPFEEPPYIRFKSNVVHLIGAELEYIGHEVGSCGVCGDCRPHHEFRIPANDTESYPSEILSSLDSWFYAQPISE